MVGGLRVLPCVFVITTDVAAKSRELSVMSDGMVNFMCNSNGLRVAPIFVSLRIFLGELST